MINEKDLISVVVPIYNVEKYLKKCLVSIKNQIYTNIEVILVDDGSSDNSPSIADRFAKAYDNFSVIHKKNGGLSSARNAGLKKANGKYIMFIDSDDWIDSSMIEVLYHSCINHNAEISICGFKRCKDENDYEVYSSSKSNDKYADIFSGIDAMNKLYDENVLTEFVVAWNKLYDINLFDDIIYPEGKIHEDEFTTYKLFYKCKNVVYVHNKMYYYRITEGSIMNKKYNKNRLQVLEAFKERKNFAKHINQNMFYQNTLRRYCNLCIDCYAKSRKFLDDKELLTDIKKETRSVYKEYVDTNPKFNKDLIRFKAFMINYNLYRCFNYFY